MSELYDDEDLKKLTGRHRAREQAAWLRGRGIPHRRESSRIIVLRDHVREWIEGRPIVTSGGPDWAAMNG